MMTPKERVINTLTGKPASPIAWVEHGLDPGIIEKAYNVTLPPLTGDPKSFDYHLQYIRRQQRLCELTGVCCVGAPRYYTMAPRIYKDDSHNGALTDMASLEKLVFVKLTTEHWDNLKRIVDEKGDYALHASITTGIGHVWQTMDLMAFSVATVENPGLLREILRRYTDWTCEVVRHCNTIGVDLFWSFDDFAFKTGTVYSPSVLREIVLPFARTVAKEIKLPWIFHSDGNYMLVLDDIISLGMNGLNPLEPGNMDLPELMRRYPHITLVGNVEVDTLARGTPEQVRATVRECFKTLYNNGRFMASSSNSIPGYAVPENVKSMFDEIRKCAEQPSATLPKKRGKATARE